MGHRAYRDYEEPDASLLRVVRVKTKAGMRQEIVERLSQKGVLRVLNRVVIWALDADTDDQLYLCEYWSGLDEFGNGTHSESDANFWADTEDLIEERTVVLEADPIWAQGVRDPAGVEATLAASRSDSN
jgi:hypothetical protein